MLCLEFAIPPLPQFVTAGHAVWKPGDRHFARTFGVYDLLLVTRGTFYMTEEGTEYEISPGKLLVLEAGLPHIGHRSCEEDTEIYWVHFIHGHAATRIRQEDIPWSVLLSKGTVEDVEPPAQQRMYLPKFAAVDVQAIEPILRGLNDTHNRLNGENAILLHLLLAKLFAALQAECARTSAPEPSERLARAAVAYLNEHWKEPFDRASLEEELHFQAGYIARCMKKHIGKTPLQYVLHLRLEEAKKLLGGTVLGISEIAYRVGIRDANYMTRLFTAKHGVTPGAYRRMLQRQRDEGEAGPKIPIDNDFPAGL
ncbi:MULTISPECIES: AraC family transcriptional regulator [Paenibacillus]|uniref:Transcriptional regulator, AraC family n=2 Tax=Paenibacillus lactis TaxID=228574 RepID=G4HAU8_9BACL|nr:AraC family transcriptional regulator [Paenibacillus lactis]EHB67057.1 transcriptional regulator, AraC family [Paenibacillus lactis 154]MBP1895730.1 AraC-like DNA-binding protein [Paenibacillus lactis]HAG00583.1 AraC family transcriptional regulator [Paenibacillus lactis]